MRRNIHFGRGITMKEWVTWVLELNGYLKNFPAHNRNTIQPLDKDKLLDILEYGVPALWHREFTVQGFDPVDQGLQKFVEFCTCLELGEPSKDKLRVKNPLSQKMQGNVRLKFLQHLLLHLQVKRSSIAICMDVTGPTTLRTVLNWSNAQNAQSQTWIVPRRIRRATKI